MYWFFRLGSTGSVLPPSSEFFDGVPVIGVRFAGSGLKL